MQVLIVKLTSMGDLIHVLPAVSDAVNAIPGIHFDWVADEIFADIPKLHPAIDQIITMAHRRWKRGKWQAFKNKEMTHAWKKLREKQYDIVIDAQTNIKSAVITRIAKGVYCGMDKNSAREKFVQLAYEKTFHIPVKQHAITRQRQLFAQVLNYPLPETAPDFAIQRDRLPELPITLPPRYLVFVHSTTWATKHWPESYWQQLMSFANEAGYQVVLPWGSAAEQAQAERLAQNYPMAIVLPRLSILQQASVLAHAIGAVCVDTGLGHLAAALNTPAVHMYGPTDLALIGATGQHQLLLSAAYECAPCYLHDCKFGSEPACFMKDIKPEKVWQNLQSLLCHSR